MVRNSTVFDLVCLLIQNWDWGSLSRILLASSHSRSCFPPFSNTIRLEPLFNYKNKLTAFGPTLSIISYKSQEYDRNWQLSHLISLYYVILCYWPVFVNIFIYIYINDCLQCALRLNAFIKNAYWFVIAPLKAPNSNQCITRMIKSPSLWVT